MQSKVMVLRRALVLICLVASSHAVAGVKFTSTSVASNTASRSEFRETGSPALTVYGGVAGSISTTVPVDGANTYDSCVNNDNGGVGLWACNSKRIYPDLRLVIQFVSDSVGGYPVAATVAASGTTGGSTITPEAGSSAFVAAGGTSTIVLRWGRLCELASGGRLTNACEAGTENPDTGKISFDVKIGVSKDNDDTISDGDDSTTVSFIVAGIGHDVNSQLSVGGDCDDTTAYGVCAYEIMPGDQKVILKNLSGNNNFPSNTPLNFKYVRLMWAQSTAISENEIHSAIPSSQYSDLEVTKDASGSYSLSPARVEGFTNDATYAFRVAVVDEANNVGYYSPNTQSCPAGARTNCHVATPGEVYGVLSENMNCFVATAAFGSQMAPQVQVFRNFRDRYLLTSSVGRSLVKWYYAHSPDFAKKIAANETLRTTARYALWPLLAFAWSATHFGFALTLGGWLALALAAILSVRRVRGARA